jgi:hypothetical protein
VIKTPFKYRRGARPHLVARQAHPNKVLVDKATEDRPEMRLFLESNGGLAR